MLTQSDMGGAPRYYVVAIGPVDSRYVLADCRRRDQAMRLARQMQRGGLLAPLRVECEDGRVYQVQRRRAAVAE